MSDELRIDSVFTKKIISTFLERSIKKRYGYDVKVKLNGFHATVIDNEARVHLDADAVIPKKEISRIFGMEE